MRMGLKSIMLMIILGLALTGLTAGGAADKGSAAVEDAYPRKDTLVIALENLPVNLLPINNNNGMNNRVMSSIMDTLWQARRDGGYEGRLAESWEAAADSMSYTVWLRKGVKFHDGSPFNSQTVYDWYNIMKETAAAKFFYETFVAGVEIIDEYTLKYNLKVPLGEYFLSQLAGYAMVFSIDAYNKVGEEGLRTSPVGTGPYKLKEWSVNQVVLEANPDYWGGAPNKQQVIYRALPDASAAVVSAEAGEIDVLYYAPAATARNLQDNPNARVAVIEAPSFQNALIMANLQAKPFDSQAVRQAIAYGIDREFIVDVAREGFGYPNAQVLAPTVSGFDPSYDGLAYDPDKAKALLTQAGYPNGQGLPEISLMIYEGNTKEAEIIQENMRSLGIRLKVEIVELNTWFERARSGDFMLNMLPWGVSSVGAAHQYLFHTNSIGTRGNYGKYSNPQVDSLINQSMEEADYDKMVVLMQQANRIITEEAPFINTYTPIEIYVVNKAWETDRILEFFIPGMSPYYY